MSWNKSFIIVKEVKNQNLNEIIKSIGYGKLNFSKKASFREVSNREQEGIAFGIIEDGFWIVSPYQISKFFHETPSILEKNLSKEFNKTTILAIEENGTVRGFGLNLMKNGKRRRVISGCDGEYYFSFGEPLKIEEENYLRIKEGLDEEEKEEIREDEGEFGLENYIKFESLWGTPFDLMRKEIGKSFDEIYNENPLFSIYKP